MADAETFNNTIVEITELLNRFARFGVKLGLESTHALLTRVDNPHLRVPIIHVAGTNGKGSVCAYLSSILTQAGYRVGRYISPHLVDWTERICINERAIPPQDLLAVLQHLETVIQTHDLEATQFEVITVAAWLYFAQQQVDIAVMEVGLGGRLDATNVCDRPLVSVITSISRDHWQRLGPTLGHIAAEKAGILKSHCPAIIGSLPSEAETVITQRIHDLHCPAYQVIPSTLEDDHHLQYHPPKPVTPSPVVSSSVSSSLTLLPLSPLRYTSPLHGLHQRINSALAIATIQVLQHHHGWSISPESIQQGLAQTRWPGRLQWLRWNHHKILIDGAHNDASAAVLRQYVDNLPQPIHWVMGMISTKDHQAIFEALLRGGDRLSLVPVPDHSTANTDELAKLAQHCCPGLSHCHCHPEIIALLNDLTATPPPTSPSTAASGTIVVCGSLYLIGHMLKHRPPATNH